MGEVDDSTSEQAIREAINQGETLNDVDKIYNKYMKKEVHHLW